MAKQRRNQARNNSGRENTNAQSQQTEQNQPTAQPQARQNQPAAANQGMSTLTRSEYIQRSIENKKRVIDENRGAQVFVSDSIAGANIFTAIRTLDTLDATIRRLWGNGVETGDASKWVEEISSLREQAERIEKMGIEILSKCSNLRDVRNPFLYRLIERHKEGTEGANEASAENIAESETATEPSKKARKLASDS